MDWHNQTVLVTGAAGFIGSRLAGRLAARGVQVTVPTRRPESRKSLALLPGVRLLAADSHDPPFATSVSSGFDGPFAAGALTKA